MQYKTITFDQAIELYNQGFIELYYPGTLPSTSEYYPYAVNFEQAAFKYRKIPISNLLGFLNCEYICDKIIGFDEETSSITWIYLYGKDKARLRQWEENKTKGQFVYILTNPRYPELVKIGKAVNPINRLESINSAGTISEWTLRYAQPVLDDYKVENLVHKHFEHLRRDSDQGHSREFFEVSFDQAVQALTYYSQDYWAGEPIVY
jgi:hypothetical protein